MDGEGFEPLWSLPIGYLKILITPVDGEGFEPLWSLPIDYLNILITPMDGEGFEPSKASPTDLQSAPFGHSGIHPNYMGPIGLEPMTLCL